MNTSNKRLPRALDPGEAFFFLSDHIGCMNFVVFAERAGHLDVQRLPAALAVLQQENQLLAASIRWTEADGLWFEPAPGQAVSLHCHACSEHDWQDWITAELSAPFPVGVAPLMRCLYLELASPARSVLALSFHHAVADGRSGTVLLKRLLALLAAAPDAPLAAATTTLLPSMAEVHPPPFCWAEQAQAAKQLKTTLITDYRRHGPLAPLPWLNPQASARRPQMVRLRLDADTTRSLIAQARAHHTSVHGVLCAAQLLAQTALQSDATPGAFFLSCPVDMRAYLEPPQPSSPIGFLTSLISNTFLLGPDTRLWDLAADIVGQTRLQIARGEGHLLYNLFGLNGAPVRPQDLADFRKKQMASMPNTMVSNLGAVASVAEDPAVEAISFALCPMPYQTLFTAASSYCDQLILNVGFDAEKLAPAAAHTLVQHLHRHLLAAADGSVL